jgi:hypothetical protein
MGPTSRNLTPGPTSLRMGSTCIFTATVEGGREDEQVFRGGGEGRESGMIHVEYWLA